MERRSRSKPASRRHTRRFRPGGDVDRAGLRSPGSGHRAARGRRFRLGPGRPFCPAGLHRTGVRSSGTGTSVVKFSLKPIDPSGLELKQAPKQPSLVQVTGNVEDSPSITRMMSEPGTSGRRSVPDGGFGPPLQPSETGFSESGFP